MASYVPHVLTLDTPAKTGASAPLLPLAASVVDKRGASVFRTRTVFVRYIEETVALDDVAEYRVELPVGSSAALLLEVSLMLGGAQ